MADAGAGAGQEQYASTVSEMTIRIVLIYKTINSDQFFAAWSSILAVHNGSHRRKNFVNHT